MFGILGWIVFGLVVGAIAKLLMPGRDPGGFIVTILLGIVGAVLGGWMGRVMGLYREGEPDCGDRSALATQGLQRAVIEAATIAEPVALPVECQQWHD